MSKKLYRSRNDWKIAGVCGGIAEYYDIDPTLVRIAAVVLIFLHFLGLLAYILAWILIPRRPLVLEDVRPAGQGPTAAPSHFPSSSNIIVGAILIGIGLIFLLRHMYWWFSFGLMAAIVFIGLGIFLLVSWNRKNGVNTPPSGEVL